MADLSYQIQYKDSLAQMNWSNLGPPITADSGSATVSDLITNTSQRFYRVMLVP